MKAATRTAKITANASHLSPWSAFDMLMDASLMLAYTVFPSAARGGEFSVLLPIDSDQCHDGQCGWRNEAQH
jgi:hypothetical protein